MSCLLYLELASSLGLIYTAYMQQSHNRWRWRCWTHLICNKKINADGHLCYGNTGFIGCILASLLYCFLQPAAVFLPLLFFIWCNFPWLALITTTPFTGATARREQMLHVIPLLHCTRGGTAMPLLKINNSIQTRTLAYIQCQCFLTSSANAFNICA